MAVTRGPQRDMTRRFCSSVSAFDACTSNTASIRLAVTFACCPPGPDERLARSSTSSRGMSTLRATCSPAMAGRRYLRSGLLRTAHVMHQPVCEQRAKDHRSDRQREAPRPALTRDPRVLAPHPGDQCGHEKDNGHELHLARQFLGVL